MSVQDSYPLEKGNLLASRGDADLYMIGRRLRKRYSQFLDKYPYDAALYEIRSSAASRCTQSANAFAMGFFEGRLTKDPRASQWYQEFAIETSKTSKHADDSSLHKKKDSDNPPMILPPIQPVDIYTVPKGLDQELAVKYSCPRWLSVVDNHPLVGQHEKTYIQENIQPIADRLTQLLFPDNGQSDNKQGPVNVNITTKDVQLIYQLCGFEMAFYNDDKTWCQLLWRSPHPRSARTEIASSSSPIDSVEKENDGVAAAIKERGQDFLHLEYLSDLGDYYGYGHGVPFNRHLGRPLAQALIESVDKLLAASSTTEPPETSMSSWYRQTSAASELIDHNSPTNWTFSSPLEGRNLIRPLVDNEDSYPGRLLLDAEDDKETVRRAILKFGHSETIMFWSTFLGLYERPPQSDQSDLTGKSAFRASTFASFAANMVLEVYRPLKKDSGGDGQSVTNNKHKKPETSGGGALVRLLVNEVPHVIPGCDDGDKDQSNSSPVENSHGQSAFCKWSVLRAMLIARGADQDFASCCEMGDHYEVNTPHVISHEKKTIEKECPSTEPLPLAG
ncbi:hypothetical protein BGW41_003344 [Actinomortierella wolfii]|nr:hypothetical protein BGW41_003344 [Actinomortierella wolfii]